MGEKRRPTQEERATEYVDSPRMTHRIRIGKEISCCIQGNYGLYAVSTGIDDSDDARCTCPSDYYPCKHVLALRMTFRGVPDSFVDVEEVIQGLKSRSNDELLNIIREMVRRSSGVLSVLGIEGFEEDEGKADKDE